jgi:hypothetical protein
MRFAALGDDMKFGKWGNLVLLFVVILGGCGIWVLYPYPDSLRIKWIVISLFIIGQCAVVGYMVIGRIDGILIDDRNRISLERFQWTAWLIVQLGGYFVECFANVAAGQPFPTIQPQLLILQGIVSVSGRQQHNRRHQRSNPRRPLPSKYPAAEPW